MKCTALAKQMALHKSVTNCLLSPTLHDHVQGRWRKFCTEISMLKELVSTVPITKNKVEDVSWLNFLRMTKAKLITSLQIDLSVWA